MGVPEQRQSARPSEGLQDGLAGDACAAPVSRIFGFMICAPPTQRGFPLEASQISGSCNCYGQADAQVFKKYSQMKLQMKREALQKLNRHANEQGRSLDTGRPN